MIKYNLIMVLDKSEENILFCYRSKEPYIEKYNLVGGKIDEGEAFIESAYRELIEETGITKKDILLYPLMDYTWHPIDMSMYVFAGVLNKDVLLKEEIHELHWIPITDDFFNIDKYAGEGNIGHMVEIYKQLRDKIIQGI